jgi:hypothetical protein
MQFQDPRIRGVAPERRRASGEQEEHLHKDNHKVACAGERGGGGKRKRSSSFTFQRTLDAIVPKKLLEGSRAAPPRSWLPAEIADE